MPWEGVTVSQQRENFLRDYHLRYYSLSDLAELYSVSRKTAYSWTLADMAFDPKSIIVDKTILRDMSRVTLVTGQGQG
jgi:hypothetical protein